MRRIRIIGIGAGNPEHMTIQAIKALNTADVVFVPDKGAEKAALRELREEICRRYIERDDWRTVPLSVPKRAAAGDDYRGSVDDWHAALAESYERLFLEELGEDQTGALLVWGDPSLYDSTLRIIEAVRARGLAFDYDVIPGITSVQALAAAHRLVLNRIGEPVAITTGRKLAESGFRDEAGSTVVMLDGEQAFAMIDPAGLEIWWGAYLGAPQEILASGPLAEISDEIVRRREAARAENGWIMDTYLLRRREG
ncbi:precorrin-6A synthase (deacetylating) [Bosea sp. LjRoot90]|uniref:precorrin-6A synthase (deacetylating) n=1 Tax=Bosea sp. LjRoot90 TaxID=3342342 RepID=UPI003ECDEC58